MMVVQEWFLKKALTKMGIDTYIAEVCEVVAVLQETQKACLLKFYSKFGSFQTWIPKSVISGIK